MLYFARGSLDIVALGGRPAPQQERVELLTEDLRSARRLQGVAHGRAADHLAFRNQDVDLQIWIEEGLILCRGNT